MSQTEVPAGRRTSTPHGASADERILRATIHALSQMDPAASAAATLTDWV